MSVAFELAAGRFGTAVLAATSTINILVGTPLDLTPQAGLLTIYGNAGPAAVAGDISDNVQVIQGQGSATGQPSLVRPLSATPLGSTPGSIKLDEDMIVSRTPVTAGSRIIHSVSNAAAAARNPVYRYFLET